ncbi:transposaes IS66 [Bacillus sp. OxB-1]|uniref:IS66 family transposase n=1 Tax=Bacillus sp. (strain OxB-1) TaxID=98228 RepID=UPI0005822D40|nr:IS66 family transposase [Bacillus sp. OxB-1]BAQ08649.1 transposaes IS66 [Bacillus sp. OxB-1]
MKKLQPPSSHTTEHENRILELEEKVEKLETLVNWYEEKLRLKIHQKFGASSEKQPVGQLELNLFNEAESAAGLKEAKAEVASPPEDSSPEGKRRSRKSLAPDIPTETILYSLPPEGRACSDCGNEVHVMKTESRREIKIIPAQVKVIQHEREIYACRTCERENIRTPIIAAPMPEPVIPKSMASPSAVAYVLTQKYMVGLPLYRLEEQLRQTGVHLSRQTLSNWIIQTGERWIQPLYELMAEFLLEQEVLHADETTVQVLREDGRAASTKSYMWLYCTGRSGPPCVLFDYQTTRAAKHPKRVLKGFKGKLHTDGYPGYNDLPGVTLSGCWAHMRRKFVEAQKAVIRPKGGGKTFSEEAIDRIGAIYGIEKEITKMEKEAGIQNPEIRRAIREEKILPLAEAFFAWLKKERPTIVPKSGLGTAVTYALNQEKKLMVPFSDGRLDIDNNHAERMIKPFVIGRKNWLFSTTPRGAKVSAMAYSLIVTAKENGLDVFSYLDHLFETLPNINMDDKERLQNLLPWSEKLPVHCRLPKE